MQPDENGIVYKNLSLYQTKDSPHQYKAQIFDMLFKFGTNMQFVYTSIPEIAKVPVYNQRVKTLHLNLAADAWDKNNSKQICKLRVPSNQQGIALTAELH